MERPIYIKIPVSQQQRTLEIYRRLVQLLLLASLFAAAFAGAFPFDFAIPPGGFTYALEQKWDWSWNPWDPGHTDRIENIFFLMPIGFSAAGAIALWLRKNVAWVAIVSGLFSACVCSFAIECSQALVSFRDPSWADVWCNTLGGGIGGAVFFFIGRRLLMQLAGQLSMLNRWLTFRNRVAVLIVYAAAQLGVPLMLHQSGELDGWDYSMPLLVGNEINADKRAWNGVVASVALADRAVTPEQIAAINKGAKPIDVLGSSTAAAYELVGPGPYADLSKQEKPLIWAGKTAGQSTPIGVMTSAEEWLRTDGNAVKTIGRIRHTSEFTVVSQVATLDTGQREVAPLRIVSISNGTSLRDLTLGQDIGDWVIRVRTAVANMPDLYLHDVLGDTTQHWLAVTAKAGLIIAYVDGVERGRCEITPEAKIIWRLYPRGGFRMYIDTYGYRSYALMYRLMVMLPFGVLLGIALKALAKPLARKRGIALGAIASMAAMVELVVWIQGGGMPSIWNVVASIIFGSVAFLTLLPKRTRA